jgi:hypothetical protein
MGYAPIEVQFGGRPNDKRFLNKRAEMYWAVREWLESGGALPDDMQLVRELSAPTYSHDNARGVLVMESKEQLKDRMGSSPDKGDALALTFAHPIAPKLRGLEAQIYGNHSRVLTHYDPFAWAG